jgi:hypothetical protein
MKIQCILKRTGGSHIELGGTNYHFAPQEDGRHIAEVTDEAHISRFLSIPEAYRVVADAPVAPALAAAPIPAPTTAILNPGVTDPALQGNPLESDDGEPVTDQSELRKLLASQYKERFGRLPHGKWDAAKIDEELKKSVA